jgi:hypothetical protein
LPKTIVSGIISFMKPATSGEVIFDGKSSRLHRVKRVGALISELVHYSIGKEDVIRPESYQRSESEKEFKLAARSFTDQWRETFDKGSLQELHMKHGAYGAKAQITKWDIASSEFEFISGRHTKVGIIVASNTGELSHLLVTTHNSADGSEHGDNFSARVYLCDPRTEKALKPSGVLGTEVAQAELFDVATRVLQDLSAYGQPIKDRALHSV